MRGREEIGCICEMHGCNDEARVECSLRSQTRRNCVSPPCFARAPHFPVPSREALRAFRKCVIIYFLFFLALMGCGSEGGTEAGNPESVRVLMGSVPEETVREEAPEREISEAGDESDDSTLHEGVRCAAEWVVGWCEGDVEIAEAVRSGCLFAIPLPIAQRCVVEFVRRNDVVSTFVVPSRELQSEQTEFVVPEGTEAIDVGVVSFAGSRATPSEGVIGPFQQPLHDADHAHNDRPHHPAVHSREPERHECQEQSSPTETRRDVCGSNEHVGR